MAELIAISFFAFCGVVLSYKPIKKYQETKIQKIQKAKRMLKLKSEACRLLIEEYDINEAFEFKPPNTSYQEWEVVLNQVYCTED